jgi:hypothetical protein
MQLNRLLLFSVIATLWGFQLNAQQSSIFLDSLTQIGVCDEDGYCIPSFPNMPRPKGISVYQTRTLDYGFETNFRDSSFTYRDRVRRNRETEFNLRAPILLKDLYKLIVGFEYVEESFDFVGNNDLESPLNQTLQEKSLRTYQFKVYYTRRFKGNKYLTSRTAFSLNGDLNGSDFRDGQFTDYFRFSISGIYGLKRSISKTYGIGINAGYDFGDFSILPILYYNKQLSTKTGIELTLPASAEFRFFPSRKDLFYTGLKVAGSNFILDIDYPEVDNKVYLSKGGVQAFLNYEREIYDFLWFTVGGGYFKNVIFDVSQQDDFIGVNDHFIENDLEGAWFMRVGLFVVPPRKLMSKAL